MHSSMQASIAGTFQGRSHQYTIMHACNFTVMWFYEGEIKWVCVIIIVLDYIFKVTQLLSKLARTNISYTQIGVTSNNSALIHCVTTEHLLLSMYC